MRYKPKPFYRAGYLVADEQSTLVGRLFPQPLLEMADGKRLLDDVVGGSAAFVAYGPQAEDIAAAASGRCLALGMVPVAVLPASHNPRPQPAPFAVGRDLLGRLAALPGDKAAFMALVRPDRIVAAAATSSTSVEAFMQRIATLRAGHGAH
jgi:3-(3-hydroxy-phenyl)propionate hydroxylase